MLARVDATRPLGRDVTKNSPISHVKYSVLGISVIIYFLGEGSILPTDQSTFDTECVSCIQDKAGM